MKRVIYISILMLMLLTSCKKEVETTGVYPTIEKIEILQYYTAGDLVKGKVKVRNPETINKLDLLISGLDHYSIINLEAPYSFSLPLSFTIKSGLVNIQAISQDSILYSQDIYIQAAEPSGVIDLFTGPKTLEIASGEQAMTVAIVQDQYGNPVRDKKVNYTVSNPDESYKVEKKINGLQSDHTLKTSSQIGKALIGVNLQNSYSKESEINFIAAGPTDFKIEIIQQYPFADGRQFFQVKTSVIKDKKGNTLDNGTMVNFYFTEENEKLTAYTAYTIGGIAMVSIKNPSIVGDRSLRAVSGDASSNALNVKFEKSLVDYQLSFDVDTKVLTVGPLFGQLNQLVPDGYLLELSINKSDQKIGETYNGVYHLDLTSYPTGTYTIDCISGGITKTIKIEIKA